MKLKEEYKRLPKDIIYDAYMAIVYNIKDYDNITRIKMLDSIIKEYSQEDYLYHICTEKELLFLKYIRNNKLTRNDIKKYEWEIDELHKKFIFSKVTYSIFEEQIDNVDKALKLFNKKSKKSDDELVTFMVSVIKINGTLLSKAFYSMLNGMFKLDEKTYNAYLAHPLFHFYVDYHYIYIHNEEEEELFYRNYWDELDEIFSRRKELGIAGNFKFDIRDYYDIFYYGFPIRNIKVKKMYDEVSNLKLKTFYFQVIDDARLLYDYDHLNLFIKDDKLIKIIKEALDETPSGVLNGYTPKNYKKEVKKALDLRKNFKIEQDNACLSTADAKLFYKLYFALLEYINKKEHLSNIKKIYKQNELNPMDIYVIDDYLWQHKDTIIDEFIEINPKFNKEELDIINNFKKSITGSFIISGYEKEYTKCLGFDGKVYMIKGINCNIQELIPNDMLPQIIETTILMFKDNIIYNSFFKTNEIRFGNDFTEIIINDDKNAIKYYHL